MIACMPQRKPKKPKEPKSSESPEESMSVFLRLDPATTAAMRAFIAAQPAPPSAPATALAAIHQFLERQGFWPPPKAK